MCLRACVRACVRSVAVRSQSAFSTRGEACLCYLSSPDMQELPVALSEYLIYFFAILTRTYAPLAPSATPPKSDNPLSLRPSSSLLTALTRPLVDSRNRMFPTRCQRLKWRSC